MAAKERTVILETTKDWRKWYEQLRSEATKENLWQYINPTGMRIQRTPPTDPPKPAIDLNNLAYTKILREEWAVNKSTYLAEMGEYRLYEKRIREIRAFILDTVHLGHKYLIREQQDVPEMIAILKRKLAPKPNQEKARLTKMHRELCMPKSGTKPKDLSKNWRQLIMDMRLAEFEEVSEYTLTRDFISASEHVIPKFHDIWSNRMIEYDLDFETAGLIEPPTIDRLIDAFDVYADNMPKPRQSSNRDIAMGSFAGKSDQPQNNSQSRNARPIKCLEGEEHGFEECPYVNPEKRTADWKPDPKVEQRFVELEKQKDSPKAKKLRYVKQQLNIKRKEQMKAADSKNSKKKSDEEEKTNLAYDEDEYCGIAIDTNMSATESSEDFKNSFILDTGSSVHITNKIDNLSNMGSEQRWLLVGNSRIRMVGPGTMTLFPTEPINNVVKQKGIRLKKVWFVEGMHTNIISMSLLQKNGILYDGKSRRLWSERTEADLCNIKWDESLYFVKWNTKPNTNYRLRSELAFSSYEKKALKDSALAWHKRYGHISLEAIKKLEEATVGAVVTTDKLYGKNEDDLQEKCETCAINDNTRQVSRVPMPKPTRPFHTLFVDIVVMTEAITGEQYVLHAICPVTKFHALAAVDLKAVVPDMKAMIGQIEHTFKTHIEAIHTDGESSLNGIDFRDWCRKRHTLLIVTVPKTPEQNGPSEKAGGIIIKRARHKIQEANIPLVLWPWAVKASIYTINRTPTKALGWRTPYQEAYGTKPYVGNLYMFGAKAYVRVENKKSQKMEARAQIGYLVGYEAHNIWQIWVDHPKGFRVIRARDVIFDETKRYDPKHPFARETVRQGVPTYIDNADWGNLEDIDNDVVYGSVDENMHLRPFVSHFSPILEDGNAQNTTQDAPELAPEPIPMEIDQQPPKFAQEMEIEPEKEEYDAQEDEKMLDHDNISMEQEDIESTGGVEMNMEEEAEHGVEQKDEVEDSNPKWENSSAGSGLTNFPEAQLPQISTPTNQEAPFDSSDINHGLLTPPKELTPPTNVLNRQEGSSGNQRKAITPLTNGQKGQESTLGSSDKPQNRQNRQSNVLGSSEQSSRPIRGHRAPRAQDVSADLSQSNILTTPRVRIASKRARSPESPPTSTKREKKRARALFARQKLLRDSTLAYTFLAAQEKVENWTSTPDLPPEPRNWTTLQHHPFVKQFTNAATDEFTKLKKKGTFEFVPRPENVQILPLTWVFKYKFDKHGKLSKFKARICVRGDLQDENDLPTRAATLASRNFRMMMSLAAVFDLEIVQFDAVNAFVNSELDEDVYTFFPDGFKEAGKVMKLKRALYGLRRSPRLWQLELTRTLLGLGFSQIPDEECLFVKNGVLLLFFVDDILVFYDKATKQAEFEDIEKGLNDVYDLRKMDKCEWFLNIRITRDQAQRKIWLCQDSYITKIAERFGCNTKKPILTPISAPIVASTGSATNAEIHAYQELVGSALYAAIMTRPDIAKAVNELAKHTKNPSRVHFEQIKRVIQYLYTTRFLAIEYSPPKDPRIDAFVCASDASFGDQIDRTSSEGYLVKLYGGPIDWRATKQRLVTTSTTEAELRAITEAAKRLHVWKRIFKSIGYTPDRELCIQCDNKQTILLLTAEDPQFRTNLRHIDIYHHWLRQEVRCERLRVEWIGTKDMIADGFTKILSGQAFVNWRQHQGLVDISTLVHE